MSSSTTIIPSAGRNPAQGRIPNGMKRIVIFDTNAYRNFAPAGPLPDSRAKAVRLRQCEQAAAVFVLASPTDASVGPHCLDV